MADRAATYDLIQDFGYQPGERPDDVTTDVEWIIAVVRLGMPLSFSRAKMTSVTKDLTQGALLRAEKPLVISDDCLQITISGNKRTHKKQLSAQLKQSDVNYLVEVLPGDWVMAWLVNNKTDYERLLQQIDEGKPCNAFNDGLKFIGRVSSIRKIGNRDREVGVITSDYNLSCTGFEELDTNFFYDNSLASKDVLERDFGQWLTRIGIDVQKLFGSDTRNGLSKNNINRIIPTLLDLIVGKGPGTKGNINVAAADNKNVSATPQLSQEAPYAYMIPKTIGKLLGKSATGTSKHVLGYSDILELVQGVQTYSNKVGYQVFTPDLSSSSTPQRRMTNQEMLGTFLPYMPDFANKPLWSVLQQYLNPTINEMYTALRVNPEGNVVPTVVLRQIPFTTDAFQQSGSLAPNEVGALISKDDSRNVAVTRFLDLPRWLVPSSLISRYDVGRSDATRINFVHIYGTSSYQTNAISVQEQLVNNPPVIDHLDVMRSGMRPYMATVECWVDDTVGKAPRAWMNLVADWTIGSQFTLNGTIDSYGIQAPICEGDNIEFDGVVYHIEAVSHVCSINAATGKKQWHTSLSLTNGMRAESPRRSDTGSYPIYPGFESTDNLTFDPGLTLEQGHPTSGGSSLADHTAIVPTDQEPPPSPLDPATQDESVGTRTISRDRGRR